MNSPALDLVAAHKYFAADCFNRVWELLEKVDRTPADDRLMVALAHASFYHWLQRADCNDQSLSIAYWQISRVHATLGHVAEALSYAEQCIAQSTQLEPFYKGYAHEALARAAMLAGNNELAAEQIQRAKQQAELVEQQEDQEALLVDLASLQG